MSTTDVDEAVTRAKQLNDYFERKLITEATLVSEIAEIVSPDNIRRVMASLSPHVQLLVRQWAERLPADDEKRIMLWPLRPEVRLSFKQWLQEQERQP